MEIFISIGCGVGTLLFISFLIYLSDKYEDFTDIVFTIFALVIMTTFFTLIWYGILFE